MNDTNTCHCCDGLTVQTPAPINNRPGLKAVAYRVGTHTQSRQSLLARLSLSGQASLSGLTTRNNDDFSIGLLDAWSVMADVLSFYQERIANESYLQTATERFSILEMARMIGYELNPGVAASTYLAFTLDDTAGALGPLLDAKSTSDLREGLPPLTLDKGIKIMSIPGPGEKAQTFETVQPIEARATWNAIRPRLTLPQTPLNPDVIVFKKTDNNLKEGDILLIRETGVPDRIRKVLKVKIDNNAKTTRADLTDSPVLPKYEPPVLAITGLFKQFFMPQEKMLTQSVVKNLSAQTWREADLSALVKTNNWSAHELSQSVNTPAPSTPPSSQTGVFVYRKKVPVFGYNAPKKIKYVGNVPANPVEWEDWPVTGIEQPGMLYLDNAYEEILPGSFLAIQNPVNKDRPQPAFYQVKQVNISSRTEYGISTKTTAISLIQENDTWWKESDKYLSALRSITVYAQSELLELAELPIEDFITGKTITLDRYYPGLHTGQNVILTGERSDLNGVLSSELMKITDVTVAGGFTVLSFQKALTYSYKPQTVTINANVAKASQGETVEEVLGSGDATIPFQQFNLRQPPLTYVGAGTPSGTQTTLEVRVNGLLWQEVDYFLDHLPDERIYITRRNDDGKTAVIFGDGITGARLPTGKENVKAKYRKGIGAEGQVKANQLSQLITLPLGVKSAVNSIAATGAEDPEQLNDAKTNAPLTVLTLGRIVSLQDYADFARAFAGIGKSLATWTWKEQKRHVIITVAGSKGELVDSESDLYDHLLDAISDAGNPRIPVTLYSYVPAFFQVVVNLLLNPAYLKQTVVADVERRLREEFSFEKRSFGQPVSYSEVIACIQHTAGVAAADIDYLYRTDAAVQPDLKYLLKSRLPGNIQSDVSAELLLLDPRPVAINVVP